MGKLAKQSISGTIFIALGFVVGSVANIFIYPKVCSKEELGQFKLFMNWGAIFSQFLAVGVGTLAVRYLPRHKEKNTESELNYVLFVFPTVAIILFSALFVPFSAWFLAGITDKLLVSVWFATGIIILYSMMQTYIKVYSGLSIALKQSDKNLFVNEFVVRILFLSGFVLFFYNITTYQGLLFFIGLCQLLQLVLLIYLVKHFVFKTKFTRPKRKSLYENLGYGLYASFDSAANTLVGRLDILMIGILTLEANKLVQEYDLAFSIATMVFLPFRSLSNAASPYLSEAFQQNDMGKIEAIYKRTSINLFIIGSILFTFIYINIDDLIAIIPGDYSAIKYPILFLGIAKILDMLTSVNNSILLLSPYFRYNLWFNLFLVVLTIFTNWIFVPVLGIVGSAIATLITIIVFNILKGGFLYMKYKIAPFHPKTLVVAVLLTAIFIGFTFFPALTTNPVINMAIRSAVCAVVLFVAMTMTKPSEDLERLRVKTLKRIKLLS